MKSQILTCITDIFFISTQHILYKQFLGKKYKSRLLLTVGWGIGFLFWKAGGSLFAECKPLLHLYAWSVNFAALAILYRGHIKTKIVLINSAALLKFAAERITTFFFIFPAAMARKRYFAQAICPDVRNIISQLFFFLFVKIVLMTFAKQFRMKSADWFELFLIPAGSIVICYAIWENTCGYTGLWQDLAAAILTVLNLQAYYERQKLRLYRKKDMENRLAQQQNESLKLQYEKLKENWEKLRVLRHNMANHYALEMGYLEKGQYDMLLAYCGEKLEEIKRPMPIVYTGNIGIDSILNYKMEIAGKNQIKVEHEIEIEKEVTVSDIDLNILLGNLFDNAAEAVKRLDGDKRKLHIGIKAERSTFFLEVSNPYEGHRKKDNMGNFLTCKKDKNFHGLGLREVKRVVKKYHGKMRVSAEEKEFHVKIFIYM